MNHLEDKHHWITLTLTPNFTPHTFQILLGKFSSPQESWQEPLSRLREIRCLALPKPAEVFCIHPQKISNEIGKEFKDFQAIIKTRKEEPVSIQEPKPLLGGKNSTTLDFEPLHFGDIVSKAWCSAGQGSEGVLTLTLQRAVQESRKNTISSCCVLTSSQIANFKTNLKGAPWRERLSCSSPTR